MAGGNTRCVSMIRTGIVITTKSANGEGIYKELLETIQKNTFTFIRMGGFAPYNETRREQIPYDRLIDSKRYSWADSGSVFLGYLLVCGGFFLPISILRHSPFS
jgi:hypothetical protein